jgi:hypothetical protein
VYLRGLRNVVERMRQARPVKVLYHTHQMSVGWAGDGAEGIDDVHEENSGVVVHSHLFVVSS